MVGAFDQEMGKLKPICFLKATNYTQQRGFSLFFVNWRLLTCFFLIIQVEVHMVKGHGFKAHLPLTHIHIAVMFNFFTQLVYMILLLVV